MENKYGRFSTDGSEFITSSPKTPSPWINYLTNGEYCALCSTVGGGFSFQIDHRFNSVLRRGTFQHIEDMPGRIIYIKDEQTGELWNANVQPIGKYDSFEARHGMGYTIIKSSYHDVSAQLKFFVPIDLNAEIWTVELVNNSSSTKQLSIYSFMEFLLGNVSFDEIEVPFLALFNEATVGEFEIIFKKRAWHSKIGWAESVGDWPYNVLICTQQKPDAVVIDRHSFIGAYRSYANPIGLESELLPVVEGANKEAIAAHQWRISLLPNQHWTNVVSIAVCGQNDKDKTIKKIKSPGYVVHAFNQTKDHWKQFCEEIDIRTGDEQIDTALRYWNKYQIFVNFSFGRAPSYFHKGQCIGFRDCCQDTFGITPLNDQLARTNILKIARFFYSSGHTSGSCDRIKVDIEPSVKVDLPLWFTLAVSDYVKQSGDCDLLDEIVPYIDHGSSTIYSKMLAGIDLMIAEHGPHGLPLIGEGDWNDAANKIGDGGKGESVWLAEFLIFTINELVPLMRLKNDHNRLQIYLTRADELKTIINKYCWDGQWFTRAFNDAGLPIGVKGQKEGFIWINSQTWAVIAGVSDLKRLNMCIDSVRKYLETDFGLLSLAPAFTEQNDNIGLITRFRPGWKENGAVFSHATAFNIVARALLGRGFEAVELFKKNLPCARDPEKYKLEPYVYSQFCAGPAAESSFGEGAYHWMTGTAAWMFRAITDYIIGVRPELEGLRISPAVHPDWKTFSITRKFRGSVYRIQFQNPLGVERGIKSILLDGKEIKGNLLPVPERKFHDVTVIMG